MKYTLVTNRRGQRCWECTHDDGTIELFEPGQDLTFLVGSIQSDGETYSLRIGTEVELRVPPIPPLTKG